GKNSGHQLSQANRDCDGPRNSVFELAAFEPALDHDDENPSNQGCPCDRPGGLRELVIIFLKQQPSYPGNYERRDELNQIILRRPISPMKEQIFKPIPKNQQNGEDCAGLNNCIEKVRSHSEKTLGDDEM